MENMTRFSKNMLDKATRIQSVSQAAKILDDAGNMRTLGEVLRFYAKSENPKTMLVDGLMAADPNANRESVDKKVRNWLSGRTGTVSKQDAFMLSRVLHLDLEKMDLFLKQVTGEGIHWRNPEDIVWCYSTCHNYSYPQTKQLLERSENLAHRNGKYREASHLGYTDAVKAAVDDLLEGTEADLLNYLAYAKDSLGVLHNTAYRLFVQYMDILEKGYSDTDLESMFAEINAEDEKQAELRADGDIGPRRPQKLSAMNILEVYMYRNIVPVAKKRESREMFTGIQRSIRQNWPDEAVLSKIKHREIDVPRKVLILLFLATDGAESEFEEWDEDENILSRDEIFQNIYTRLNQMLRTCGFQTLDPRSPFDWMVLYSICADEFWDVDRRLRDILLEMFPNGNE